ncbi:MAG TPA: TAT-variant-translocated molybdopterin oxidoreductase, partial [Terriglobales bacterium]|nr:TAT-variant-translocated molybdopterin oxidoreductase [Terriglobales bacterium]
MSADESSKHIEAVCPGKKLDLVQIQQQVQNTTGPEYWRSLEELAGSQEFQEMMHREFPRGASEWLSGISRRGFLQLMGASLALAGMTACTKQPLEPIVPYVRQPEEIVPGIPLYFATAFTLAGYAHPLLAKSNMGRPTKVEGNPQHPASLGATDLFAQASLLDMYDPDRSQTITYLGEVRTWAGFLGAIRGPLAVQKPLQGGGIRILTQAISSPTLVNQLKTFLTAFPAARWHQWEPANRDNVFAGAQMAFGQPVETQYRFEAADIIVSLDADFLYSGFPGMTRYARDYAFRRLPDSDRPMNRMYMVESSVSSTGAKADHRLPVRASDVEQFARALAAGVGVNAGGGSNAQFGNFLSVLIKDLQQHRGTSVIIAGDHQPAVVHALAHAMNSALGNVGKTVVYTDPIDANPVNNADSLKQLTADMDAGKVDMLIVLGGNPVYDAPADLNFANVLKGT